MIILIRAVLLYLIFGLAYSEYRRYKVGKYRTYEDILEALSKKRFIVLNLIFNPVVVWKLRFDLWRIKRNRE